MSADLAKGTDLELVKRDVGCKAHITRISSATQARDMMMYYLWCLSSTGSEQAETSNPQPPPPPPAPITVVEHLLPARGFSIQASAVLKCTQSFVSIPRSPICPLIHVLSHSPNSFANRHLSFPFTKQNDSPFPTV